MEWNEPGIRFACFRLGMSYFAIDIMRVVEIAAFQPADTLPSPCGRELNLRGKAVPCLDLRACFHLPALPEGENGEIIVVRLRHTLLALVVDEALEVLTLPEERIVPPPDLEGYGSESILGIGLADDRVIMILDIDMLPAINAGTVAIPFQHPHERPRAAWPGREQP